MFKGLTGQFYGPFFASLWLVLCECLRGCLEVFKGLFVTFWGLFVTKFRTNLWPI